MNHSPVASLANKSPIELFTGLPCPSPVSALYVPGNAPVSVATLTAPICNSLAALRSSIERMHQKVMDKREKRTLLNKRQSKGTQLVNFTVGDYVLRSRVDEKYQNKLFVTWVGPYMVTQAESHSFRLKLLITGVERSVHSSRMKLYADDKLEVNEELLEHISAQGVVLKVDTLLGHRWSSDIHDFEILVKVHGLEDIENSWKPMTSLMEDVQVLVSNYVQRVSDAKLSAHLSKWTLRN